MAKRPERTSPATRKDSSHLPETPPPCPGIDANFVHELIEHLPVMVHFHDEQSNYILWNRESRRITGYQADEILGNPKAAELLYPDPAYRARMAEKIKLGGDYRDKETEITCSDGTRKTISWSSVSDRCPLPGCSSWIVGMDVTDRKKMQKELIATRDNMAQFIDALPLPLFAKDRDGRYSLINPAFREFFGVRDDQIIGHTVHDIWPEEDATLFHEMDLHLMERDGTQVYEHRIRNAGGEERVIVFNKSCLHDSKGRVAGIVGSFSDITEQKRAEDALRAAEAEKTVILDGTLDMVVYLSSDQKVLWANKAAARSLKTTIDKLCGKHCYELWHNRSTPCPNCPVLRAMNTGLPQEGDITTPDGRHWYIRGYPLLSDSGQVEGIVELCLDITEHRLAEQALKESEAKFEALTEATPSGIFIIQNDQFRYANSVLEGLTGYSRQEIGRMRFWDMVHPEMKDVVRDRARARLSDGEVPGRYEVKIVDRTGRIKWLDYSGTVISFEGRPAILGSVIDITDRKRIEEALTESEKRYRAIVQDQTELICRFQPDGTLTFVNEAYAAYFSRSREELPGLSIFDLMPEQEHQNAQAHLLHITPDNPIATLEHQVLLPSGEIRWQQWTDRGFFDDHGNVTAFQSVGRDITDRKQMEEALLRAKETAEEASRAKSMFLANMSHEIRTPISSILGFTDILLDNKADHDSNEYLQTIRSSAESLLYIINDILDFTKIEARKLDLKPVDFHLPTLIEQILNSFTPTAAKSSVELTAHIDPSIPPRLHGDPERLAQVIANLVGNALKFTEQGMVSLLIHPQEIMPPRIALSFSVRDTGIGIPKDKIPLLFHDFGQIDSSYSKRFKGTGLGLAISKRLVELMGGTIAVESTPGMGSTFTFSIPFQETRSESSEIPASLPTAVDKKDIPSLKVLVAEDNHANRKILEYYLSGYDISYKTVNNGREALQALQQETFDCVLMDIQMPVMDGLEATKRIRSAAQGIQDPGIPIIALTAYALESDRRKFLQAGINACLTKPLQPEALAEAIASVADEGRQSGITPGNDFSDSRKSETALDLEQLQKSFSPMFLRQMFELFIELTRPRLEELALALDRMDPAHIEILAHHIAGTAGTIKAQQVTQLARVLQETARSGDLDACRDLISKLTAQCTRVIRQIQSLNLEDIDA